MSDDEKLTGEEVDRWRARDGGGGCGEMWEYAIFRSPAGECALLGRATTHGIGWAQEAVLPTAIVERIEALKGER